MGRLRRPAECSHFTGEKTEAPGEHGAPTRPIQGTGTTEPQSKPRAHHCPRPGLDLLLAGGALPPPQLQPSLSQALALSEVKSLSRVRLFATLWTVARQAPPSMGFSRQEYWSGFPFPFPGDLPDPGIEPRSPVLEADALPLSHQGSHLLKRDTSKQTLRSLQGLRPTAFDHTHFPALPLLRPGASSRAPSPHLQPDATPRNPRGSPLSLPSKEAAPSFRAQITPPGLAPHRSSSHPTHQQHRSRPTPPPPPSPPHPQPLMSLPPWPGGSSWSSGHPGCVSDPPRGLCTRYFCLGSSSSRRVRGLHKAALAVRAEIPSFQMKNPSGGTSLVVQWLRLGASSAEGWGSVPGQGTRSNMPQ